SWCPTRRATRRRNAEIHSGRKIQTCWSEAGSFPCSGSFPSRWGCGRSGRGQSRRSRSARPGATGWPRCTSIRSCRPAKTCRVASTVFSSSEVSASCASATLAGRVRKRYPGGAYAEETLYLIVRYFGWAATLSRYSPYSQDPVVFRLSEAVRDAFSTTGPGFSVGAFNFFHPEQKALGKLVMSRTPGQ